MKLAMCARVTQKTFKLHKKSGCDFAGTHACTPDIRLTSSAQVCSRLNSPALFLINGNTVRTVTPMCSLPITTLCQERVLALVLCNGWVLGCHGLCNFSTLRIAFCSVPQSRVLLYVNGNRCHKCCAALATGCNCLALQLQEGLNE